MTNEEAIEILQNINKVYRQFTEKEIEALNMAISALKSKENELDIDLIKDYAESKIMQKLK